MTSDRGGVDIAIRMNGDAHGVFLSMGYRDK